MQQSSVLIIYLQTDKSPSSSPSNLHSSICHAPSQKKYLTRAENQQNGFQTRLSISLLKLHNSNRLHQNDKIMYWFVNMNIAATTHPPKPSLPFPPCRFAWSAFPYSYPCSQGRYSQCVGIHFGGWLWLLTDRILVNYPGP